MTRSTPRTPSPEDRGVTSRRTIVAAGAWTVPVVAVAVATPAAAASQQPTLAFVGGPFTVAACGTLADVVVHATLDGTKPAVGQTVTVTLPAGLTFSDGSTSRPFIADLNGDVVLTGVKAFGGTTTGVITASTGTLVTTAPVSVTGGGVATIRFDGGAPSVFSGVPSDAVAVGVVYSLTPSGDLYYGDTVIATSVTSASAEYTFNYNGSVSCVNYVTASGAAASYDGGAPTAFPGVPSDAVSVGSVYYLTPGGDLYYGSDVVATGVTSAVGGYSNLYNGSVTCVNYMSNGVATTLYDGVAPTVFAGVPSDAAAVGVVYFLTPGGDLYYGDTVIATGVTSASGEFTFNYNGSISCVNYVSASGAAASYDGGAPIAFAGVPTDAVSVGSVYFLTPGGDLYYGGNVVGTGVTSAKGEYSNLYNGSVTSVNYMDGSC